MMNILASWLSPSLMHAVAWTLLHFWSFAGSLFLSSPIFLPPWCLALYCKAESEPDDIREAIGAGEEPVADRNI